METALLAPNALVSLRAFLACAAKMFDVTRVCQLTKAFVVAYQTEREARLGRMKFERERAGEDK